MNKNLLLSAGLVSVLGVTMALGQVTPKSPRIGYTTRDEITTVTTRCDKFESMHEAYISDHTWTSKRNLSSNIRDAERQLQARGAANKIMWTKALKNAIGAFIVDGRRLDQIKALKIFYDCVSEDVAEAYSLDIEENKAMYEALLKAYK